VNLAKRDERFLPRLIAWEVTRSCNLNCRHCRAAARFGPYEGELSTEECFRVLANIAAFCKPIIILTGGEPMLRTDVFKLAREGTRLGLTMVMAPCGSLVTEEAARRMLDCGIRRISLSIDGATAATHDAARQVAGAFDAAVQAARNARATGLEFQVNTTVTRRNVAELERILELAVELGAAAYHPFLLVPTGRGRELADEELSAEEYERVLNWVYDRSKVSPIRLKPTCAPHYHRIVLQREEIRRRAEGLRGECKGRSQVAASSRERASAVANAQGRTGGNHGLDAFSKGCMGGQSFAFISHVGKVQICGFLETECGDLRAAGYNFRTIWNTSGVFLSLRDEDAYHGRCGVCEYRRVCGGCRARAYAVAGDYLDEEPFCAYQPGTARNQETMNDECGMMNNKRKMQSAECEVQNAEYKKQRAESEMRNGNE